MFGGLEVKGKDESSGSSSPDGLSSGNEAAVASSSFSFLQNDNNAGSASRGDHDSTTAAASTASAFGFLSGTAEASTAEDGGSNDDATTSTNMINSGDSNQSGFSFLSPSPANDVTAADGLSTASTAGSSFSFLGAAGDTKEASAGSSEAAKDAASSGFSFLSSASPSTPSAAAQPEAVTAPNQTSLVNDYSSAANANAIPGDYNSDLLSSSHQSLPAGAGISWSAPPIHGAVKKPIKKKTGKTRVGVSNSSVPAISSIPQPIAPSAMAPPQLAVPTSPKSPPLKVKAEQAHNNAEQFIREKQRSAIVMAAERAMDDKQMDRTGSNDNVSVASIEPTWKLTNEDVYAADTLTTQLSPTDETYRAAKAAAEEARKIENSPTVLSKSKFSLSGFFHRKSIGGGGVVGANTSGSNSEMTSYSSHGGVVGRPNSGGSASDVTATIGVGGLPPLPPTREENIQSATTHNEQPKRTEEEHIQREREHRQQIEKERRLQLEAEHRRAIQRQQEEVEQQRLAQEEAKRQSPREKMQSILTTFSSTTKSSTELVAALRTQYLKLSQDRITSEKNRRLAQQQISHAESLQTKAAEEEDFESADRLASVIEQHQREEMEQLEIYKSVELAMQRLEKEREGAVKRVAECFGDVFAKLKELEMKQEERRKEDGTDVLDKFASTSKRLSSETHRLNNDLKHIERDEDLVSDEQKELEDQISEGTKEFEEKCVEASDKLELVNQRIKDLRKQLLEAESEAITLNAELSTHKTSIENVRGKFARQLGRLEKKQRSVKESRAEWELEKASLEKEKTAHEAVVQAHSEDLLSMDQLLKDIQSELSVANSFEKIISQEFDEVDAADGENRIDNLDNHVLRYEAAVDEANRNVLTAETAIENLREEISTIEVHLPILEGEKKAAVSKRDFKAAGKASKEIKDALARKEQCEVELAEEAMTRREDAREELSKAVALLDEKKSIAAEKGKELGTKQMSVLKKKISHLKSILKDFDTDIDVQHAVNVTSVGVFVIESQIRVLEASGKALGERYGGWEDESKCSEVVEDNTIHGAPTIDSTADETSEKEITIEILEQYSSFKEETATLEEAIDKAAEEENFEAAAQLEEKLEVVRAGIKALGISSDALNDALLNGVDRNVIEEQEQETPDIDAPLNSEQIEDSENIDTEVDAIEPEVEPQNDVRDEKKMTGEAGQNDSTLTDADAVHNSDEEAVENED